VTDRSDFVSAGHRANPTMHTEGSNQKPRLRPIGLIAVGLLILAAPLSAFAQAADTNTTPPPADTKKDEKKRDDVVVLEPYQVSGSFGGSLAAAAQAKENNTNISDVVMSEDIGKLPDVSIADSLTRLPGITTQRTNGRSQAIYLRGMTPDFSVTTMNGREQVSTGENRGVEFDQ
jgi:iron complex outermembrane receptor protein